jgi:hypothetical protein
MQQQQLQQGGDSTVKQDPLQSVTDPFLITRKLKLVFSSDNKVTGVPKM